MNQRAGPGRTAARLCLNLALVLVACAVIQPLIAGEGPKKWECKPATNPPCDCADVNDLINRWNVDNAAIGEYRNQIAGMMAREARDGKPYMFNGDDYQNKLQKRVEQVMESVNSPGQTAAKGETDANCATTINSPTYCLCVVIKAHEDYHVEDCTASKTNLVGPGFLDYRNTRRMVEVALDEIIGFQKEIDVINRILRNMPPKCKPKQWTGVINYNETMQIAKTTPIPPDKGALVLGGSNVSKYEKNLSATVTVLNGQAYVNEDYIETSRSGQEITSMVKCHSNEQPREFPHHNVGTTSNEAHGYAKASHFSVAMGNDGYSISFRAPAMPGTYQSGRDVTPSPCGPPFTPQGISTSWALGEWSYRVKGTGKPTDLNIKGSDTQTFPMPDGSRTVKVTWNLYRSEAAGVPVASMTPLESRLTAQVPFHLAPSEHGPAAELVTRNSAACGN
jgi:hypothetical protein